jgi:hypothetical protein
MASLALEKFAKSYIEKPFAALTALCQLVLVSEPIGSLLAR